MSHIPLRPLPPRGRRLSVAHAVAPPMNQRAPIWDRPVPHEESRPPLVWLMGAHGGAGVSTLSRMLAPAADCGRQWPAVLGGESPFIVLVARETIEGLSRAHHLLRQWHSGLAGDRSVLLGLVTCAYQSGRQPKQIRQYLDVMWDLVPEDGRWRIEWQPTWPLTEMKELPVWTPGSIAPAKGPDPLAAVRNVGESLITTVTAAMRPTSEGDLK
ncbi:hypothetical protein HGA07_25125 [Nocardia veterana]|uniref:AAA domain-containing protein n=1 Tax=Nocardia veterana TaxID=132249 RepID=A0A7X6M286_9NOCA|nr:hypothetical protein [Nocardia veterana]